MPAQINSIIEWLDVLHLAPLIHMAPAAASTAAILFAMHRARNPLALPGVLVAIPTLFHLILLAGNWSLDDARNQGWLTKPTVSTIITF